MAQNSRYSQFLVDPNLPYLPPPHLGLPPPPNAPFENPHLSMPMGPPAVLVENVCKVLEPLQEEIRHMASIMTGISKTTCDTSKTIHELSEQIKSLEVAVKKLDPSAGSDGDDEGLGGAQGEVQRPPKKRARSSKETSANEPTKGQRTVMFSVVRKALYSGCEVEDMNGLKEGLTGDELAKRIADDPPEPWLPDFRISYKHKDNEFWVDKKIIPTALDHADAKEALAKGNIPQEFWTKEYLHKHIVNGIWESARKALQTNADPKKKEEARTKQGKANVKSRNERLFRAHYDLAFGDDEHPPFKVVVEEKSRNIPPKLVVPEVMSDVVEETFGFGQIPTDITLEKYKTDRAAFKYEGVTPFWRHKMWDVIFNDMDKVLRDRNAYIQPRYYAGAKVRGKREENPDKANTIPVRALYRCHLDEVWYNRLPESMKKLVKPSPSGWEVKEELAQMEVETTGS
ncbi:unnamed protein product [Rhizoctonia solani]|uniref:Uncharacterized protein n=1 Tax=Rhizoctonia solani TaxID=456999 RepID=A0A8H2WZF2_9AGAM|nr:unnamed protein product [Rhizoctonia solani]